MRRLGVLLAAVMLTIVVVGPGRALVTAAAPRAAIPTAIELRTVATELVLPTSLFSMPQSANRMFFTEKAGFVKEIVNGSGAGASFLDISDRVQSAGFEQGLFSAAFAPDVRTAEFKWLYVTYTRNPSGGAENGPIVLSRFRVNAQLSSADPATEQIMLSIDKPTGPCSGQDLKIHDSGEIVFDPDDPTLLYLGIGDGGCFNDPNNWGQTRCFVTPFDPCAGNKRLLGKLIRIQVSPTNPTPVIPADNPAIDATVGGNTPSRRDEVWAWGLRHPYRISFDPVTKDLFIADVGEGTFEEINVQPAHSQSSSQAGLNYGWRCREGNQINQPCTPAGDPALVRGPVGGYNRTGMQAAVIGGQVMRGPAVPNLYGVYLFADFYSGALYGLRRTEGGSWEQSVFTTISIDGAPRSGPGLGFQPVTFGRDTCNNVYVASYDTGRVYRVGEGGQAPACTGGGFAFAPTTIRSFAPIPNW